MLPTTSPRFQLSTPTRSSPPILKLWAALEADSHRPEVRDTIRAEIRKGTIRVRPMPGRPDRVVVEDLTRLER